MTGFWDDAKVISEYSRAQAIDDGALVDVSELAKEAGITFPVAMTRTAWAETVKVPKGLEGCQDETGRLWDVVYMLRCSIRKSKGREVRYGVHVRNDKRERTPPLVQLKALCGPGDDAAPVITIMLPDED